nr:uncharacterized protein LOC109767123 [Aegilops tauschii subsp. strangulata]
MFCILIGLKTPIAFYPKRSYYGAPDYRCNHCGASFWWRERKKQLLVKVIITRLGYDNCWWFLSCRECHKTTYVFGRHFRCSDPTCPSVNADPSYCVCTFGSDGGAEAEFMWFDKAARSVVGKPVLPLIEHKYPKVCACCFYLHQELPAYKHSAVLPS